MNSSVLQSNESTNDISTNTAQDDTIEIYDEVNTSVVNPSDVMIADASNAPDSKLSQTRQSVTSDPPNVKPVSHEVHWEGTVRKKGDWLPRWEVRYLVLDGASLTYYNSKEEARANRNLRGRMIITKVLPENYGKAHGFLIETKGHKLFHLCCSTELEKDMWVEMMQAAIDEPILNEKSTSNINNNSNPLLNTFNAQDGASSASNHNTNNESYTGENNYQVSPTQVDLRSFYSAFRKLLISHSNSPQFFPKLSRDVVLTSNYAPTVPFWGDYHGLDGVLHFFSILYDTVEFTSFFVTDIAQATANSTAVIAGRETMKNKHNDRKFTQQWQHTLEFTMDGRVKSITITADPVAASAVFGCNATSSLSLPMTSLVNTNMNNYANNYGNQEQLIGTLHVYVIRGEEIKNVGDGSPLMQEQTDETEYEQMKQLEQNFKTPIFLGMRLLMDGKTNVYAPTSSNQHPSVVKTNVSELKDFYNPVWYSKHEIPFRQAYKQKPCFMLIEAWSAQLNGNVSKLTPVESSQSQNIAATINPTTTSISGNVSNDQNISQLQSSTGNNDSLPITTTTPTSNISSSDLQYKQLNQPTAGNEPPVTESDESKCTTLSVDDNVDQNTPNSTAAAPDSASATNATTKSSIDIIKEELIGVAKVNLAPFLALASTSRTVRESVLHSDIARGAVPQWYTLLSANETKNSCGRVQLSISFEASPEPAPGSGGMNRNNSSTVSNSDSNTLDQEAITPTLRPLNAVLPLSRAVLSKERSYRDTRRDNHQFRVGNTNFDIPKRYQMIKGVGQGAYGCVIAASDVETGLALAIKNVPNAFNDLIDAKRILREIRLMRHLNHANLVNLVDLIRPSSLRDFNDVYIVTDLMETDLHRVIHSNQSLSDDHIQYFLYQMLLALYYIHSAEVLHRDLKPSNILVNSDCKLKLCDFGLARGVEGLDSGLTEYVVTRWYRAPELLLSSKYDKPMDVWAIGCILAEMLGRRPLFPGHDYLHQLKIIMDVIGSPKEDSLQFITNPKAKRFILRQPVKTGVGLASIYPRATPLCLDLLGKMLMFNPADRITIEECFEHEYLKSIRDVNLEKKCESTFDFSFENCELTRKKLQELIFQDVCHFHPEALQDDKQDLVIENYTLGTTTTGSDGEHSNNTSTVKKLPDTVPNNASNLGKMDSIV